MWAGFMAITWILMLIKTEPSFLCSTLSCCNGESWTRCWARRSTSCFTGRCVAVWDSHTPTRTMPVEKSSNQPGSAQMGRSCMCRRQAPPPRLLQVIEPASDNPAGSGWNGRTTTSKTRENLFKLPSIPAMMWRPWASALLLQHTSELQTFMLLQPNCWHISQFPTGNPEETRTRHTPAKFKFNDSSHHKFKVLALYEGPFQWFSLLIMYKINFTQLLLTCLFKNMQ